MTWQPVILALSLISAAAAATPVFNSDAASKVSWKFKDKPQKDVSKIILEWEPFSMLEDTTGVDSKGGVGVNIKSGDGEFIPWTVEPRIRGGKSQY